MVHVKFLRHGNVSRNEVEAGTGSQVERSRRVLLSGCDRGEVFAVALTPMQAHRLAVRLLAVVERCEKVK